MSAPGRPKRESSLGEEVAQRPEGRPSGAPNRPKRESSPGEEVAKRPEGRPSGAPLDQEAQDSHWMAQALAQADTVMNLTTPNPRVGCVIVRHGECLGAGATQQAGGPHAEIMALRDAKARGHDLAGSTFYVTLEPCSHYGRTPPCVDAVIAARPARVVVALTDPNPQVGGRGLKRLREAGIEVVQGVASEAALAQNPGFVGRMTRGTPWLWLKLAGSIDGRSALHNGVSQWITGAAARQDGHLWRARACAVLTGIGTVLADDPQLTPRQGRILRLPRKIVLDSRLRLPVDARLLDGTPTWVFTTERAPPRDAELAHRHAEVVRLPAGNDGRLDLSAVMRWLGEHDINEIHAEAGPRLSGALLQAGVVDELLVYQAPLLLGDAQPMAQLPARDTLPEGAAFEFIDVGQVGADLRLRARHAERWSALRRAIAV
ncbi:MAG: bifunctional diaminohydroxyphosphoribosylaminopyrimidine deaminase/5-amino-6-(5-phosphoribosylamino)uracil reductase RibD [Pigmentiphaga sp.]